MRPHKTPEEKERRREAYRRLREGGKDPHFAMVCRDWTDNKINLILAGATPALRW